MDVMRDYHQNPLAIGDRVRNIESAWLGQIVATEPDHNHPHGLMLVCLGVNWWTGKLDEDDRQWHAPADVVQAGRSRIPNAINMM